MARLKGIFCPIYVGAEISVGGDIGVVVTVSLVMLALDVLGVALGPISSVQGCLTRYPATFGGILGFRGSGWGSGSGWGCQAATLVATLKALIFCER